MDWIIVATLVGVVLLIPTAYAGLIGAPYAPTRTAAIRKAFAAINIGPEDVVVDLGAGDGKVLLEAAARGAKAIGYELSPIMWTVALVRSIVFQLLPSAIMTPSESPPHLRGRKTLIRVRYGNFYKKTLPPETTIIFAFLMPDKMERLRQYIVKQSLPQGKFLLAYTFPFKDIPPLHVIREPKCGPVYVYELSSLSEEATKSAG
jgi:hypothetical protein